MTTFFNAKTQSREGVFTAGKGGAEKVSTVLPCE